MEVLLPAEMMEFLDVLEFDRLYSSHTVMSYRRNLQQFVGWLMKNGLTTNIFEITPPIIRSYLSFLKTILKGISIKQKIATLKSLYHYYQDLDEALEPPSFPKNIKAMLRPVQSLTTAQIQCLLDAARGREQGLSALPDSPRRRCQIGNCIRDRAMLSLLAGTGIRVHELVGINISDIDFGERTIRIRGKGHKERTVYFDVPTMISALDHYLRWRREQGITHDALFVNSRDKGRLTTRSVQRMLKLYLDLAGLPNWVSPHILRHSFATLTIENGANIKAVSQLLGHARVETTIKFYLHLSSEFVRQVYSLTNPFASRQRSVSDIIAQRRNMVFQV